MIKVLFICHGNICRSAMAEFILKDIVKREGIEEDFYIESAGSSVYDPGSPVYPAAKECLYIHGIRNSEINQKVSRNIIKSDYDKFDYILVAEDDNINGVLRVVGKDIDNKIYKILDFSNNKKLKGKDIADPWYTRDFEKSYADIVEGCRGFLEHLKIL